MCPADWTQGRDQHHQDRTRGDGVSKQCQGDIVGQAFRHDARSDHSGDKQQGADELGDRLFG